MWQFPDIDPVAFSIGPLVVRWYALAYMAGFLLGWRYCLYLAGLDRRTRPNARDIDDFLPWAVAGVILGGRAGYVLFYNFAHYIESPGDILMLWHGGMSFHGGALGVILALIVFSFRRKFPLFQISDFVCAAVPIGLFFGRIANFINGELYGRPTDSALGMVFPHGGDVPRHPSQLYEAGCEGAILFLVLYALVSRAGVRARPGIVSGTFLAGYGIFRAALEFFREPDSQLGLLGGMISMGQALSLPMIVAGAVMIIYALRRGPVKSASGKAKEDNGHVPA
jgi:phosphatidylglycerol---prolipoprotein diacylglyceryl transferase